MKTGKSRRWQQQQQQQSGRPVLVTFYVARPTRACGGHEPARMVSKPAVDGKSYSNRRAELLEYSRNLRAPPHCNTVSVVPDADQTAGRRARTQQQKIRQRCFGGWSWKNVLVLIFPFNSKAKRPRSRQESNRNNNQKVSRDHSGLRDKLMSVFRQRSS